MITLIIHDDIVRIVILHILREGIGSPPLGDHGKAECPASVSVVGAVKIRLIPFCRYLIGDKDSFGRELLESIVVGTMSCC